MKIWRPALVSPRSELSRWSRLCRMLGREEQERADKICYVYRADRIIGSLLP